MNRYVDILNRIRQNGDLNWLTPNQRQAYNLVRERLEFLDEVNLWGGRGVGKTFVAWQLYKQGIAVYAPRLEDVEPANLLRVVVVDNSDWRRSAVRAAMHLCRVQGYDKIVLITAEPVQEHIAATELRLTEEDIAKVTENLRTIGAVPHADAPRNLWETVNPLLIDA